LNYGAIHFQGHKST